MADDNLLLNAIQTGANIGNMRVMRQERMMELQAQQAMNAIHERQLNAQADMLAQHAALYKQQALKEQDDALTEKSVLAAAQEHHNYLVNELGIPEEQATPEVIGAVSRVAPKVGDTLAQSYERVQRGQKAMKEENFKPFVQELQTPDGKTIQVLHKSPNQIQMLPHATAGEQVADEVRDKDGNLVSYVVPGANGPRFFPAKTAQPGAAAKAEIKSIYAKITRLEEKSEGMKDTSFSVVHPLTGVPNTEKAALEKQIADLKSQAAKLDVMGSQGSKKTAATAPSGQRVKVRSKTDGKEYTVPVEQLDEAIQQGYEKVAE